MTDSQWIAETFGPVAEGEYNGAESYYKADLVKWAKKLQSLPGDEFIGECGAAIHVSALVNSFRGNWEHEHFKATVCYREAKRRHIADGHAEECRGDTAYSLAHARVMRSQGYTPSPSVSCTCDKA